MEAWYDTAMAALGGKLKRRLKAWNFRRLARLKYRHVYRINKFSSGLPMRLQVRRCKTFRHRAARIDQFVIGIEKLERQVQKRAVLTMFLVALYVGLVVSTIGLVNDTVDRSSGTGWLIGVIPVVMTVVLLTAGVWYISWVLRHQVWEQLLIRLLRLCVVLERNPEKWPWPHFKTSVNLELERVARLIDRYPTNLETTDALSSGVVGATAAGVAAKFREYKVWVAQPGPFTYTDLIEELTTALYAFASDSWHELPRAVPQIDKTATRLARFVWAIVFVALVGLLIAIAIFQSNLGAVGSIGASLVAVLIVFVLGKLGVTLSTLQQQAEVAAKLDIKPKA